MRIAYRYLLMALLTSAFVGRSAPGLSQVAYQGRSVVMSQHGMVAAENPLAAQIGASILASGGTAADAAIAANAAMNVFSPMMCGIGGDLFAIVYDAKEQKVHGLNASGWAPAKLTPAFLKEAGFQSMPIDGIHSVTVPGAVDGWAKLRERFGKKSFKELLSPAAHYAEHGFPVTEHVAQYWASTIDKLNASEGARKTFLPDGRPPVPGSIFRNPDLAWSLGQIAEHGRDAFYEGGIAKRILALSEKLEGTLTADDLRQFSSEWVEPISTSYRGWTVYEMPPNGQGIAALMMLNLMENYPLREYGHNSARALHVMIEAKKLAYADMLKFVGDPHSGRVPVTELLSAEYTRKRAVEIDLSKANCEVPYGDPLEIARDTTYLCAVDREGNMVSLIQSIYYQFGSGLVAEGTGFPLQNRGGLFTLEQDHPNALAGRKRPLHTIIPGFMRRGDRRVAFGIMGGWNQAQAHAQFVSNFVDHEMNVQQALEAARFTKLTFGGCDLQIEGRVPEQVLQELAAMGHQVEVLPALAQQMGGGQAILHEGATAVNHGGSDPRKDGAAIPEH